MEMTFDPLTKVSLYMTRPLLTSHSSLSLPSSSTHMTCLLLKYNKLLSVSGPWHMFLLHLLPLTLPIAGSLIQASAQIAAVPDNPSSVTPTFLVLLYPGIITTEITNLIHSFTNFLSLSPSIVNSTKAIHLFCSPCCLTQSLALSKCLIRQVK